MSATTIIVNDETPRRQYTAAASQTNFDFPFPVFAAGDLEVYLTPNGSDANDTNDLLQLTTDYTVTGADSQASCVVVLNSGATAGDTITIIRVVDIARTSDYQIGGDLLAETINREQDSEIMIAQQLRADIKSAIRKQVTDEVGSNNDMLLPSTEFRKNKALGFDGAGNPAVSTKTLAQIDAATDILLNTTGAVTDAGNVLYTQTGTGAVPRTVEAALQDTVNIKDFGGVCDGVTNDAGALILALALGRPVIIPDEAVFTFDGAQTVTFIENLNLVSPKVQCTFTLAAGDHAITDAVEVNNPHAENITVKGVTTSEVDCTAISNTGGSAKNYSIQYTLSSAAECEVGDYLYVGYTTGTGSHPVAQGVWKITGVSGSNVTVKHTLNNTWPTMTVTSARVIPLKTILRWPTTDRGLAISGTQFRSLENVVLASQFDITTGTPSDTSSDGLQVGTASDFLNTGSTESQQTNRGAIWCKNVGIVEWSGNGLQVSGGSAYFFQAAACSNGWRGMQAARTGFVGAKYCIASGNGASGFEAEEVGHVLANGAVAAGNHQQGVYVIGPASVSFALGYAYLNVTHGLDARNFGTILADAATVDANTLYGVYTTAGQVVFGSSAVTDNNGTYDVYCTEGGVVDANGASALNVVEVDHDSGSRVITTTGDLVPPPIIYLENSTTGAATRFSTSSIADMTIASDTAGSGTFSNRLTIKGDTGTIYPVTGGAANLGRSSEQFNGVYSNSLLITDGITVPGATAGYATIYVDTADGDLKVRFGDGTIKTIVVDT